MPIQEIAQLLHHNRTLSFIALSTSRDENDVHFEQRSYLAQCLKSNYTLKYLEINCCGNDIFMQADNEEGESDPTSAEIDFWLRLNRAGRKFLLDDRYGCHPAVLSEIIHKASMQGDDVLFWFLQNGLISHFDQGMMNRPLSARFERECSCTRGFNARKYSIGLFLDSLSLARNERRIQRPFNRIANLKTICR